MKILHIVKLFFPPERGGVEIFARELCDELVNLGHEVRVLCVSNDNKFHNEKIGNLSIIRPPLWKRLFSMPISFSAFFHTKKHLEWADIIHFHHPNPWFNFIMCFLRIETPLLIQWHSDIVRQKYLMPLYKPFQNILLKKTKIIVGTTPIYIKNSPHLKPFKNKCTYIPISINPNRFIENKKLTQKIKQKFKDKPIIFSLGRLVKYKGFEYLIEAAKDIEAYFLIGGTGPLYNKLQNKIKLSGINNKVILLGMLNDEELPSYYSACNIFVLPSITKNEAFGLVQLEAMMFGKPVISTNIENSGVSWVNKHHESGLIVEPHNSYELSSAIKQLLTDKTLYNKLSNGAKNRFNRLFNIRNIAEQYIEIYKKIYDKT